LIVVLGACVAACQDDGASTSGGTSDGSGDSGADDGTSGGDAGSGSDATGDGETSGDDGTSDTGTDTGATAEPGEPGISTEYGHGCRIDGDGALWCWGTMYCGLGDGTDWSRAMARIGTDNDWQQVSTGYRHTCAVKQDRTLWCWGSGDEGQLGLGLLDEGPTVCRDEPQQVAPDGSWVRVAVGTRHTCAIQSDATLWCWGDNEGAQIGDGAVGPMYTRFEPVQVGRGRHWAGVAARDTHTCAREMDGTMWCWGSGAPLGDGTEGWSSTPVLVAGPPAVALAEGSRTEHNCAIDEDGRLWCWGRPGWGVLATEDTEPVLAPTIIDVGVPVRRAAVAYNNTCVVRDDGQLWCWGYNRSGQLLNGEQGPGVHETTPLQVTTRSDWVDVSVGNNYICARDGDGKDHCWGDNYSGEVGAGTSGSDNTPLLEVSEVGVWAGGAPSTGWTQVAAGGSHGCGLRDDGSLWCWGNRYSGALGTGDDVADCSASNPATCHITTPAPVTGSGWDTISAGGGHTCALRNGGELWCWGSNSYGAAGDGGTEHVRVPTRLGADSDWTLVAAGYWHSCALRGTGSLWCWGTDGCGESGSGVGGGTVPTPTQVGLDADWQHVAAGQRHTCGVRQGGTLWCWGYNAYGEIGDGSIDTQPPGEYDPLNVSKLVPTQAIGTGYVKAALGEVHTCAIRDDGSLWCWGSNRVGQLGVDVPGDDAVEPTPQQVGNATTWADVVAGGSSTCGHRTDGTVWCWGENTSGQIGIGEVDFDEPVDRPTQVGTFADWGQVSMISSGVCGVRGDAIWCWGSNYSGKLGNDSTFNAAQPTQVIDDG
jgi:alpha-tubulin suppressor-like RCC1 family protein